MDYSTARIRRHGYAELMILDSTSLLRTLKRMRRFHMAMTAFGSRLDDESRRALSTLLRLVGCGDKAGNYARVILVTRRGTQRFAAALGFIREQMPELLADRRVFRCVIKGDPVRYREFCRALGDAEPMGLS